MRVVRFTARTSEPILGCVPSTMPHNVLAQAYLASLEALDLTAADGLARELLLSTLLELTGQMGPMSSRDATDWLVSTVVTLYKEGFPRPN